jgi:hypothetical protein
MHMDQHTQLLEQPFRSSTIRLIDHKEIRYLHDTSFHRLDRIATFRYQEHYRGVRGLYDVELCLSYSHGLDENQVLPKRLQQVPHSLSCLGQTTVAPARGHTPNKHAGIKVMLLHTDTIAEDGATRKRAARVDSNNANRVSLLACVRSEGVSDGAFASAWRSRNAHTVASAEGRSNTSHNLWDLGAVPFDVRHELRQCPLVTSEHPLNEIHDSNILHGGAQGRHPARVGAGKYHREVRTVEGHALGYT